MSDRKKISQETKKMVWDKCDGRCWYCGSKVNPFFFHFDHIHPFSKGGEDNIENLAVACISCNFSKRNLDLWEWKLKIYKDQGFALSRDEKEILKSEGIDILDDPYAWEPPILFYFERDYFKDKTHARGFQKPYNVIHFKGWE